MFLEVEISAITEYERRTLLFQKEPSLHDGTVSDQSTWQSFQLHD